MKKIKRYIYKDIGRTNRRCTCEVVLAGYGDSYGEWCLVCGGVIRTLEEIERDMKDIEAGELEDDIPGRNLSGLPLKQGLKQQE